MTRYLISNSPSEAPNDVELARSQTEAVTGSELCGDFGGLLDDGPPSLERGHRPGHLTGSAFVVDSGLDHCLMMFHTKLQRWLQPGGHADGDGNLAHVALREATEETQIDGLQVLEPAIDLDIHRVDPPAEDAHLHFDVRFLVIAPAGAVAVGNHESEALRWVVFSDLADLGVDEGLLRMADTAASILR
jgi:8-oxo-dGTP pyrophosphatase MutT (NUDIX family)